MNGLDSTLASILHRGWWLLLLRGLAAIAFGVLTWFQPGISLAVLILFFGVYSLVDGVLSTFTAIGGRKQNEYWWMLLLRGLVGIGVGLITFIAPGVTALALLFYIALWAIATGVLEIAVAIRLRKEIRGELVLMLAGLASVIFGVVLVTRPGAGALALLWLIATYAVVFGVLLVIVALRARSFAGALKAR